MSVDNIDNITQSLKAKYPDVGIRSVEVNPDTGKATFMLDPTKKSLAFIDGKGGPSGVMARPYRAAGSTITRDVVNRTNLDLAAPDAFDEEPKAAFERALRFYYTDPTVGSATNILASLARKGFENDIDDENIKNFFDVWAFDVKLDELLEQIFLDFFRVGHVTTYKVLSKYEPRVSFLSPIPGQQMKNPTTGKSPGTAAGSEETGAKKNVWSKGFLPVAYTVLNPLLVNIEGNLLFEKVSVTLTPPPELGELLKKPSSEITPEEKELIKALPSDLKAAAEGGGEFRLNSQLVGQITYRKQPYERYAKPRTSRVFDTLEYKKSLKEADLSTLDGITNYILKITVGNDTYPVTGQAELEAAAELFNTPSKSFDVVWNHTLEVEKIVSPEIDKILGKGKYEQVNNDLTTGLGVTRSIIDGGGEANAAEIELLTKGLLEEINYARRQVTRWLYAEYQQIAEAMGFDRIPKVRWDDGILMDTILYMNTLATLVDRRMLSYRTSLEALGFDYGNELRNMQEELPLVEDGTFGILGSPFQQAGVGGNVQPNQAAPKGTPSNGRPTGQPAGKKSKDTTPTKKPSQPKQAKKSGQTASVDFSITAEMSSAEYANFLDGARETLSDEEYVYFVEQSAKHRFLGR